MDDSTALPRPFVARFLPWILGAAFLVLYLATLHPWVGVANAALVTQLGGWDADLAFSEPVLWLLTRPLRLLSASAFPGAMNVLAAVFGALSVALLARSVALLPHDRMREQRVRDHGENPVLHIRLAWVPVVFAAGLLGLQRTFWENATLQTGEMLDLLLFASGVAALVEYRLDLRERWLWMTAFAVGAGISNNWAMIAFAPFFLMAVIWLRGWSFFEAGFLGRMTLFGLAGLSLYLVLPLGAWITGASDLGFWQSLKANLTLQKAYLLGVPRGRGLLLGLVMVLPLGLVAIRWQGAKGSSLERIAGTTAIVLLQWMWLLMAVFLAFDLAFSPRRLMYLERGSGELAMLTFSFCSALAAGYFAGWFLLVGGTSPEKEWDRPHPALQILGRAAAGLVVLAAFGVPATLAYRNLPGVRAQNSGATRDLAQALTEGLPDAPALVLSDDPNATRFLTIELAQRPGVPHHVLVDTRRGPDARYRKWLAARHGAALPGLRDFGDATENVAGLLSDVVAGAASNGVVRYLNPSFGFFFERVRSIPDGVGFKVQPVPVTFQKPSPPPGALEGALGVWTRQTPRWEPVLRMREVQAPDARELTLFWSRAANALAVALQREGRLADAATVFQQARRINPDNVLARVNSEVNALAAAGKPIGTNLVGQIANLPLVPALNNDGPMDEPQALLNYGRALLASPDRLPRQAWEALHRSGELNPGSLAAASGQVEALIQGGQLEAARTALEALSRTHPESSLSREDFAGRKRLEVYHALARGDAKSAEKLLDEVRGQFGNDVSLLNLLSQLYISQQRYAEAIPVLEQWRKLRLDDPAASIRLAAILIERRQFDQALRVLDQFLGQKSDNRPARINRAICLLQMGRLDDSRREYMALAEKMPDEPLLLFGLGEIAFRRKSTNEAIAHFEKYLKHAPTNTTEYAEVGARVQALRGGR